MAQERRLGFPCPSLSVCVCVYACVSTYIFLNFLFSSICENVVPHCIDTTIAHMYITFLAFSVFLFSQFFFFLSLLLFYFCLCNIRVLRFKYITANEHETRRRKKKKKTSKKNIFPTHSAVVFPSPLFLSFFLSRFSLVVSH